MALISVTGLEFTAPVFFNFSVKRLPPFSISGHFVSRDSILKELYPPFSYIRLQDKDTTQDLPVTGFFCVCDHFMYYSNTCEDLISVAGFHLFYVLFLLLPLSHKTEIVFRHKTSFFQVKIWCQKPHRQITILKWLPCQRYICESLIYLVTSYSTIFSSLSCVGETKNNLFLLWADKTFLLYKDKSKLKIGIITIFVSIPNPNNQPFLC